MESSNGFDLLYLFGLGGRCYAGAGRGPLREELSVEIQYHLRRWCNGVDGGGRKPWSRGGYKICLFEEHLSIVEKKVGHSCYQR